MEANLKYSRLPVKNDVGNAALKVLAVNRVVNPSVDWRKLIKEHNGLTLHNYTDII